jgi:DNA-binding CsgD family transcriptional regulator
MSLSQASVALEINVTAKPGGRPIPSYCLDVGWSTHSDQRRARAYYTTGPIHEDPLMRCFSASSGGASTMNRASILSAKQWKSTLLFNEVYRPLALGDAIVSWRSPSPFEHHLLVFKRRKGERAFGDRETALVNMFHGECAEAFDSTVPLPPAALTARERETLALLLSPAAAKEIAARLGLTVNTTNGYVKLIYKKLGVRSRPELMARYSPARSARGRREIESRSR